MHHLSVAVFSQDAFDSFECVCLEGWTGRLCSEDIDECIIQPCENQATCFVSGHSLCNEMGLGLYIHVLLQNTFGSYVCGCRPGFTGPRCNLEVNECELSPCENGATCFVSSFQWFCCQVRTIGYPLFLLCFFQLRI